MPRCCYRNIQQSIGTAVSAIPLQLLFSFGPIFFAAVSGLSLDGHFSPCDSITLGCAADGVPWIAFGIAVASYVICIGILLFELRKEYELAQLTLDEQQICKMLMGQFVHGYSFNILALTLIYLTGYLLAFEQEASYALRLLPIYVLMAVFLCVTCVFICFIEKGSFMVYVIFTLLPAGVWLFLGLAQVPLIVLKLDDNLNARWAVILIPFWVGCMVETCGFCFWFIMASGTLIGKATDDVSPEAEMGKIANRSLLGIVVMLSLVAFCAMLCEEEDGIFDFSAFHITSPLWGLWLCWASLYFLDHVIDGALGVRSWCGDCALRHKEYSREKAEAAARASRGAGETPAPGIEATGAGAKKLAAADAKRKKEEEEFNQHLARLHGARSTSAVDVTLAGILKRLREHPELINENNKQKLVTASKLVRRRNPSYWTRDTAQLFGTTLRQFTRMNDILHRVPSLTHLRATQQRPGPPEV